MPKHNKQYVVSVIEFASFVRIVYCVVKINHFEYTVMDVSSFRYPAKYLPSNTLKGSLTVS